MLIIRNMNLISVQSWTYLFYLVLETQIEVGENEKCCGNMSR